jgi:hypothetical protein
MLNNEAWNFLFEIISSICKSTFKMGFQFLLCLILSTLVNHSKIFYIKGKIIETIAHKCKHCRDPIVDM